jgi:putative hydrolase of the HAD superfamily
MKIETISFDLDDTLWNNRPVVAEALSRLYRELVRRHPGLDSVWPESDFRSLATTLGGQQTTVDFTALRRLHLREVLKPLSLAPEELESEVERWTRAYVQWRSRVCLYPGVIPMLSRLSRRYRLIAVTNGNADLKAIGLEGLFTSVCSSGQEGVGKPDPEIYRIVTERLGIEPATVLHVGDHWQHDVVAADAAGLRTLWVSEQPVPQEQARLRRFCGRIPHVTHLEPWLDTSTRHGP